MTQTWTALAPYFVVLLLVLAAGMAWWFIAQAEAAAEADRDRYIDYDELSILVDRKAVWIEYILNGRVVAREEVFPPHQFNIEYVGRIDTRIQRPRFTVVK